MNEPDTTNNAWKLEYNDWVELVLPALKFLSNQSIGTSSSYEAFNPFVAFDESSQSWRWVSEEMFDNDDQLSVLYYHWMEERNSLQLDSSIAESSAVVPEARFRTDYIVQVSTFEERETFREQERQRFNNPHRSFTYRQHGYESTVGPVKGVYSRESNMMKARGHALLVRDRPACVNILTLVHDSAARLPNGQGTRADICTLLKDSQYLADDIAEAQLHTVVSGALDRLHYEKDPCVKYDGAQKVWIHRHRNRTEEEFERIHQMQRAAIRAKKLASTMKSNMRKIQQQQIKLQQQQNQVQSNVDSTVKGCPQNVPHAHKKQKQSKLCAKLSESAESSSAIVNANDSVNLNKQLLNYQEVPQKQSKIQAILQLPDNTLPDVAFTERKHLLQQTSRLQAQQLLANRKPSTSGIPNLNVQQHDSTMELVKASSLMSDFQLANQQKQASGLNVCAATSVTLQHISRPQISNSSKQLFSQHNLILMSQKKQDKQYSTITTSATERVNPSSPWNNEYVAKLLKSNKFNTTTTLQQQVATSSAALLTSSVVNLLSNVQNINSPSVKRNVLNLNAIRLLSLPPRLVNVDQSKLLKADQSMVLRSTSNNVPIVQSNISSTNMLMVSHNITNTSQLMTSRLPTLDNAQLPVLNVKPSSSLNSLMASLAPVTMKQVQQQKQIGQMQTLRPQILSTNVQPQQQAQQIRTLFLSPQQQQQLKQLQQLRSPASQPLAAQQATSPAHLPITLQGFLQLINQNQININNHAASVPTTKR
ncbi:hypothetical protein HELRODRAFT_187887 [Helobdella robusta]|uniref:Uncharacterized protein n=1 Tax=Helobdella robusta TaxID=6412 RepID=T1FPG1_HELRO|nr:hypothetical protein HELRODRAFT_187887 [Helobdella robusta]ESO12471.1 hypothetical protein HELRODRAFT_187887 [Helobdella robusta]